MEDPQGWVAALGRLARRRAWVTLVDAAGTMLVVHRGGGAPSLTVEQVGWLPRTKVKSSCTVLDASGVMYFMCTILRALSCS